MACKTVFELLEKIEQKPGLYLGTASVTALRHFLVGYKFARQEMGILPTEMELDFYREFQPWLQRHLQVETVQSWDQIILIKYLDECAAFSEFFQLLGEFLQRDKGENIDLAFWDDSEETIEKVA